MLAEWKTSAAGRLTALARFVNLYPYERDATPIVRGGRSRKGHDRHDQRRH
jgi:hypothetical protein